MWRWIWSVSVCVCISFVVLNSYFTSHFNSFSTLTGVPKADHSIARRIKLQEYHDDRVQRYDNKIAGVQNPPRSGFSFSILLERPRNEEQDSAYKKYLDASVEAIELISSKYGMIDIASSNISLVNMKNEIHSIDDLNKHLYRKEGDIVTGGKDKIGRAGNATKETKRIRFYEKDYKAMLETLPTISSILNIDNMDPQLQLDVVDLLLNKIGVPLRCKFLPVTFADALELDKEGLPLPMQIALWGLTKSLDDCSHLGGAIDVMGNLINFVHNALESGEQVRLKRQGYELVGDVHESINGDMLGLFGSRMKKITTARDEFFNCEALSGEKRELIMEQEGDVYAFSSWPAGKTKTSAHRREATPILLDLQVGGRKKWEDIQKLKPHSWNPLHLQKSWMLYDAKGGYVDGVQVVDGVPVTMSHRGDAMDFLDGKLEHAAVKGGRLLIDWNKEMMKARKSVPMVQYILSLRPPNGYRWQIARQYLGVTVMYLDYKWKDIVHLLFVHPPPKLDSSSMAVDDDISMAVDDDESDKKPSANDGKVTSDEIVTRDKMLKLRLTYAVTQETTFQRAVEILLQACRYDIFSDNSKIKEPGSRHKIIVDMKGKGIIDDNVLDEADKIYNATTQNPGNTISNRTTDLLAQANVDDLLKRYAKLGKNITSNANVLDNAFFVMCSGKADPNNLMKHSEQNMDSPLVPFTLPADGTNLGTYQVNHDGSAKNGEMMTINFDVSKFVPITYSGLLGRTQKGKEPEGTTNAQQSVKFYDKLIRRVHQGRDSQTLDLSEGMIVMTKGDSKTIETWIEANLVLVWFRDKPEKKKAVKATTKAKKATKKGKKKGGKK